MRTAAKVDTNQREIVQALRGIGATVQHLHDVGRGCPDLLVGFRGENWLFEIKSQKGKVRDSQWAWMKDWRGNAFIVRSVDEAIELLTGYDSPADVPPF